MIADEEHLAPGAPARAAERRLSFIGSVVLWLSMPYYYYGGARIVAVVVYLVCILAVLRQRSIGLVDLILLIFLLGGILLRSLQIGDPLVALLYFRLYWGFVFFYFLYRRFPELPLERLTLVLSWLTIVEYLAIRIVPGLWLSLPNYDLTFRGQIQGWGILGGVHSFGGNRTVSGVLLLALFAYLEGAARSRSWRFLPLIASVMCASGTALLLTLLYALWRFRSPVVWVAVLAVGYALLFVVGDAMSFSKLSAPYLEFIWTYKAAQVQDALRVIGTGWVTTLFGTAAVGSESESVRGFGMFFGDFAFLDFVVRFGVLGIAMMVLLLTRKVRGLSTAPILIIIAGSFHYPVLFALPGQLLFGYFLAQRRRPPREAQRAAVPLDIAPGELSQT
jgi:hypothetical protein